MRLSCTLSTVRSCARYEFIEGNKAIRTKYLCDTSYTRQLHNKSMSFSSAKTPRRQDRAHLTLSARLVSLDRTVWEYHTWAALSFRPFLTKVLYQEIGIERHKSMHSKRSSKKTLKKTPKKTLEGIQKQTKGYIISVLHVRPILSCLYSCCKHLVVR